MSDWLSPASDDTERLEQYTWRVQSLAGLLAEVDALKEIEEVPFWRGHAESTWPLNSTMARWVQSNLMNKSFSSLVEHPTDETVFRDFSRFALFKFRQALNPSEDFLAVCKQKNLDAHFEVIKNLQQFPEIYSPWIVETGTPMLDWSQDPLVGLFFAISNFRGDALVSGQGALFAYLKSRSGNVLIKGPVSELFTAWESAIDRDERPGMPLIVCPDKQMDEERPKAQSAVYVLQADLAHSLDVYWYKKSEEVERQIFLKILIPGHVKLDLWEFLQGNHITARRLFPAAKVL